MKNKVLLLSFFWIINLVSCELPTSSPFNSNCVCVDFQDCHNMKINFYGETSFVYKNSIYKPCHLNQVCCFAENIDIQPYENFTQCGIYNSSINEIAGRDTEQGEFPWMVAILIKNDNEYDYVSGGSLIHPKVVLTAAHKLYDTTVEQFINAQSLTVRVGSNVLTDSVGYEIDVERIIPHKNFIYIRSHNNIALLILEKNLILTPNVRTICLPPLNINFDSKVCVATGFGKSTLDSESLTEKLKKINLPLLKNDKCQSKLRSYSRVSPYFILDNTLLCAGGIVGKDTCDGDGGSPLICRNEKYYYQVGIVAYGFGCFVDKVPGVYTNVSHHYQWITDTFDANGLDTKWFIPM